MLLIDVVDPFLLDRATLTRRGLSETSRAAYRADIATWARQIARLDGRLPPRPTSGDPDPFTIVSVADLTESTIKSAYRVIRLTEAPATVQRRVGTLRLLMHWLLVEGHLTSDPTLRIEAPLRPTRLPAGWDDDELARLAATVWQDRPGRPNSRRWPALERACFAILATTGLRAAELCALTNLSMRDAGQEALLDVIGKGDQQRAVPIPPEAVSVVRHYVTERDARLGTQPPSAPLLLTTQGTPLTRGSLRHLVDGWITRAGISRFDGEAVHALRHSYAKGLIRSGVPAPAVQNLLGHRDLKTTGIYVKATAADVRDAALLSPARRVLREVSAPVADPAPGV
ncbi:tyrosine-type recombinase/integrase [Cellulomonas sp.]|uniref:tyrosine-type recombinase/integrase n=1 Tax=Cellulomonas sp. TaxID=40001 RepID=UPI0025C4AE4B|nr:tyrosine-type recombinase/integrase [Cellulomonas sp.]